MTPRHTAARRDAAIASLLLPTAVYLGSTGLTHFDPALSGYCAATVISFAVATYHVSLFWRRRPSAFYGRVLFAALRRPRSLLLAMRSGTRNIGTQSFIAQRSKLRWAAHMLLAWGTLASFVITLPLVWGWIHFDAVGDQIYQTRVFSLPVMRFDTASTLGWVIFNQLNLAAGAVVLGASYFLAIRFRRSAATSRFHLAPLLLLLAVALSGLALPATAQLSAEWAMRIAATIHQALVVLLLVSLPYGKLIHLFIRPLHIGAHLLRTTSAVHGACASCNSPFAPAAQLDGVASLLTEHGFAFARHQRLCPSCRRRRIATAHGALLGARFKPEPTAAAQHREAA